MKSFPALSRLFFFTLSIAACVSWQSSQKDICLPNMAQVFNPISKKHFCVDITLHTPSGQTLPASNQSFYDCKQICTSQKKRLLTHQEWLLACEGTPQNQCNTHRQHPVVRKLKHPTPWYFKGINCKQGNQAWNHCLNDPSINLQKDTLALPDEFPECKSKYGIQHMVGNLGEWVDDSPKSNPSFGRFNGGLYPQSKSSCQYSTTAHLKSYRDYSLGCRCAL